MGSFCQVSCHSTLPPTSHYDKTAALVRFPYMTFLRAMKVILETERLVLRLAVAGDLDYLVQLHQDPDVMRYIGPARPRSQVRGRLAKIMAGYEADPSHGIWMAQRKQDGTCIGWACLKDLDTSPEQEIGYRLAKEHWGQGYATEIAKGLLRYGFESLGLPYLVAVARPDNLASRRVLEKAGMQLVGPAHYYHAEVVLYRLQRDEWLPDPEI